MEAGAGQRLDRGDREEVADRVLRQAVSADLVPVGVKTRARPPRELLEVEMERRPEQALVDRQLPYAADGIGQHFCDVIGPKLDAGVLPPRAHPGPIGGKPLPLERPFLCRNRFAGGCECDAADDRQRSEAGSHEKSELATPEDLLLTENTAPCPG
jgi:hypothetical protein